MAANPPEDRHHYDEAPRLTTKPERAFRRSYLDIPALARYGGRLPESASPYVVRAYRAAGAEMDMLYIWRDGSHTATVNLSACCELERQVHAARRFCIQLGHRAPEQLNAQLIANIWPELGTMSNEWLIRRIIEQREADDHTEAMQEIYAQHEERLPELKQWPPTLASSPRKETNSLATMFGRARKRKPRKLRDDVKRHRDVIKTAACDLGLKGRRYCQELDKLGESTSDDWRKEGCPQSYTAAYDMGELWRNRIKDEKYRITHEGKSSGRYDD